MLKRIPLSLLFGFFGVFFLTFQLHAGSGNQEDLIGIVNPEQVLASYSDFSEEYQQYTPSEQELTQFSQLNGKEITVIFGTWCHDSEREVPRLLKLLDTSEVTLHKFTLLAVDRNKQEPSGLASQKGLQYTPTIILSDAGEELGRIIEKPAISITSDLVNFTK